MSFGQAQAKGAIMRLGALILAWALVAQVPAFAEEKPVTTLRVTLAASLKNPLGQNLVDFKNEVEEKSEGAIKIDIFDNAQLYTETEGRAAVASGKIDIGVVPLGDYAQDVEVAGLFQQPFLFDKKALVVAATKATNPIRRLIDEAILAKAGVRALFWQPYGGTVLFSASAPVVHPRDLAGRKVSAFDAGTANFVALCGGDAKLVSDAEVFKALEGGTVDANMTGILSLKERELWRVAKSITKIRYSEILFVAVINDKAWRGLSSDQQKIISDAARKVEQSIWRWYALLEADAYALANEKGMKIAEPTPEDIYAWRICSSLIVESFISDAGEDGEKLMTAYGKLRADPCCSQQ